MSKYLDTIYESTGAIIDVARDLENFANAFYILGNNEFGARLLMNSNELMKAQKHINNAVGENINNGLEDSYKSVANTISACLSINELNKKDS